VSGRLRLRRGVVVGEDPLTVEIDGERRPAWADTALLGEMRAGDEVIVNIAAVELGLGSGGFDVVHLNLARGLDAPPPTGDEHVMKLNYTSLQHPVDPVEAAVALRRISSPMGNKTAAPAVLVLPLHGHLAPAAWALAQNTDGGAGEDADRDEDLIVGYVQTGGGALPGSLSHDVAELRERGLLAGHITAAPGYGGELEAISVCGALDAARRLGWEVALVGPGPGIIGSDSEFGHGGMAALDNAHAALALGLPTTLSPRLSSADPRERHVDLSHHTYTVLELLLAPLEVAVPEGEDRIAAALEDAPGKHRLRLAAANLDGYEASALPASTMGRTLREDPLFFAAPLAAGAALRDSAGAALRRKG
jgi:hypothetical protein